MSPLRAAAVALAFAVAPAAANKNLAPPSAAAERPVAVESRPLAEVSIHPEREVSAQVLPRDESRIAAEITARIESIAVQVGARVARGAVLARLDCRDHELTAERARAALAAARARAALAEQQLARARELGARGFYSAEALSVRTTELEVLRAEVEQARLHVTASERTLEKCTVRAPYAGVVRERLGQTGELAAPGTPLVLLAATDSVEVSAAVPVALAVSLGGASSIRFEGDGGTRPLRLLRISPAIEPRTRTVEARFAFAGAPAAPGAVGRVLWRDPQPHLPAELLVRREGRLGVFLDEDGIARFRPLAQAQEGRAAPAGALAAQARIVVSGQAALVDGQRLR